MQASPWSRRLPFILRVCIVASLVGAGGWAFAEAVLTSESADAAETVTTTVSDPIARWAQVAGTLLCVGAVAAMSWVPSVRFGGGVAAVALLVSAAFAAYVWTDVASFAPDAMTMAFDESDGSCNGCTATLENGVGIVVATVASVLGAAGTGLISLMAER